jgi:hypothetical protein
VGFPRWVSDQVSAEAAGFSEEDAVLLLGSWCR